MCKTSVFCVLGVFGEAQYVKRNRMLSTVPEVWSSPTLPLAESQMIKGVFQDLLQAQVPFPI